MSNAAEIERARREQAELLARFETETTASERAGILLGLADWLFEEILLTETTGERC